MRAAVQPSNGRLAFPRKAAYAASPALAAWGGPGPPSTPGGITIPVIRYLAALLLRVGGWRIEGSTPTHSRYVLIAAPHTSNWDFVWTMAMAIVLRVRLNWLAKHTLFKPLIGPLLIRWGGVPIRRHESANRVESIADAIADSESMVLLVPVEGTRARADSWKSGFYHIARRAKVPIVLGFLDYSRRVGGFGPSLVPSSNLSADMDAMREFYAPLRGRYPELESPVRLREELA